MFPTKAMEDQNLWQIEFWPSESHLISIFHPTSLVSRTLKLFCAFGLNPLHMWESLDNTFLLGLSEDDLFFDLSYNNSPFESTPDKTKDETRFSINFVFSIFLYEMENFSQVSDWAPHNFYTRFINLLKCAVTSKELQNHVHYFTKVNIFSHNQRSSSIATTNDSSEDEELKGYSENYFLDNDSEFQKKFELSDRKENKQNETLGPFSSMKGTLSKLLGNKIKRRHTVAIAKPEKSFQDIACDFEQSIARMRRGDNVANLSEDFYSKNPNPGPSSILMLEPIVANQYKHIDSVYSSILDILYCPPQNFHSLMDHMSDPYIQQCRASLNSQEELVTTWTTVLGETGIHPDIICPHAFSRRQLEYLSLVVDTLSRCAFTTFPRTFGCKTPAWETSGDLLRTVLHQLRSNAVTAPKPKKEGKTERRSLSLRARALSQSFSGRLSGSRNLIEWCKRNHRDANIADNLELGCFEESEMGAANRLLSWLWELRASEMGRLSSQAKIYIEQLYSVSFCNAHFLEEYREQRVLRKLAIRSATSVTAILRDKEYPSHIPLLAACQKGWLWADMVLSFVAWNRDKGFCMQAKIAPDFTREINFLGESFLG